MTDAAKKLRRVRIGQCMYCGFQFQLCRRDRETGLSLQCCPRCLMVNNGATMPSTLESGAQT